MKLTIKQWKQNKYIHQSTVTLAEYICLTTKEIPISSNYIFNTTHHSKFNNPIFIKSSKHIPLPSRSIPKDIVNNQIIEFTNSLLWRLHFIGSPPNPKYNPKFTIMPKQKIRPYPFFGYIPEINIMKDKLEPILNIEPIIKSKQDNTITNLLKEFPDTTICLTDKNLGFAALYTTHYKELVYSHLKNPKTYHSCNQTIESITNLVIKRLKSLKNHYNRFLNPSEKLFITKQLPIKTNFPKFKGMPKVHKKGKLNIRPIVTSFNWYTRPIALILNERIKRLTTRTLPYVLKSADQLISLLPITLKPTEILVTIDITAMYPSINRIKLLEALQIYYPTDKLLPILLEFILNNSYCEFNNETYLQIQGIPMGDNASVCLANLFCSVYLDQVINNCKQITQYHRYIDDIFIIWNGTKNDLLPYIKIWNLLSSLTLELVDVSPTTINYLDITIYKEEYTNKIQTSLFHKPISKFNYLSPSSCHPPHILSGWIYAEILRHYRLNTNPTIRYLKLNEFKKKLLTRGYKYRFLDPIFKKALTKHFNPTTKPKTNPKKLILPFILPYYPDQRSCLIFKTIKSSLKQITSHYLPQHRPILVHSVLPNISSSINRQP